MPMLLSPEPQPENHCSKTFISNFHQTFKCSVTKVKRVVLVILSVYESRYWGPCLQCRHYEMRSELLGAILEAIFMDGGGGDERGGCNSNRKNKKKKSI